jgi:hypothetical protein|nr:MULTISPECIES: hypothetical protein [unclassified Moraxella]
MFSKLKMVGLTMVFGLFGCQQNTSTQRADNALVVKSQATPQDKISISRLAISHSAKKEPAKEVLPNNKDSNTITVATCPVAALHGKLRVKGKCLVVGTGGNTDIQPIFSEDSASWNEATKTLTYLGKDYKEGDEIHLGGGGLLNEAEFKNSPNVSIPDCPNTNLFAVCP